MPSRIGTSHGGLRKFGFEAGTTSPSGLELLTKDLESLGVEAGITPHPSVWRLNAVSSKEYRLVHYVVYIFGKRTTDIRLKYLIA